MLDFSHLTLFFAAAIVLLVTPGPAVIYIVTRSVEQGRLAGVVSCMGITTGGMAHVLAAALGLSSILVRSAVAFSVVKYLGAAYLVYLGVRTLFSRQKSDAPEITRRPLRKLYADGILVNLLNPKTALFFFAFIPQFVDIEAGHVALQMAALGMMFVLMGMISDGAYALAAGTAGNWLRGNRRVASVQRYLTGSVYMLLGAAAAFGGSHRK